MERLRYTPIGWSKKYEFSEADLRCAVEVIDQYFDKSGEIKDYFYDLQQIISNNVYGGKIDNEFD